MKNLLVANHFRDNNKYNRNAIETILTAQIENSVELGWSTKDIILIANFDYYYLGVQSINTELNKFCMTGSKMFALEALFRNGSAPDVVWCHDLDAWQNVEFDCPDFKDAGATYYSQPKFNGGSIFWRSSSKDIVERIVDELKDNSLNKEEPTINKVFRSDEYKDRITIVNNTFNVGCSGFVKRYNRADKPVRVLHFNPTNRIAWETHALDRNKIGEVAVSKRLEKLLRKHYPNLQTKITSKIKKR